MEFEARGEGMSDINKDITTSHLVKAVDELEKMSPFAEFDSEGDVYFVCPFCKSGDWGESHKSDCQWLKVARLVKRLNEYE